MAHSPGPTYPRDVRRNPRQLRDDVTRLAAAGLDWVEFATQATAVLARAFPFQSSCWHLVDPGTVLFTGSLNQNVGCSGTWLAEHEYVLDDVNKWSFLAHSGRRAGATSIATHGDLTRSARHRSHEGFGFGDELRGSFVVDGVYWGAAAFLRVRDEPWYTQDEVDLLAGLSEVIAAALRRALLTATVVTEQPPGYGPGVVTFDADGEPESISPAAELWIEQLVEIPRPSRPADSKIVRAIATQARLLRPGQDPLGLGARSRVQTADGSWLLLYGATLSGGADGRTAVIIQPATPSEVAPLVALAYGLSERERQITALCMQGQSTKQIAGTLALSPYTVQDHLKSIFGKTGVRSRRELIGQIFLQHYIPRWEDLPGTPPGWTAHSL
jgi:DNA-binding CsgD family transcriptional regulator